jgi:acyl dehydratase
MSDKQEVWPAGRPQVGQKAEMTRTVALQNIELFTAISGDHNPLPLPDRCASFSLRRSLCWFLLPIRC